MGALIARDPNPILEYGIATRARDPGAPNGDAYLVVERDGRVVVAVVDGLGHGVHAAEAARCAVEAIRHCAGAGLGDIVQDCHEALVETRGVALTIATVSEGIMCWFGVGNVQGVLMRGDGRRESVPQRGGIVGHRRLPPLRVGTVSIDPGDVLVLATDGLRHGIVGASPPCGELSQSARRLLAEHARGSDDALVFVGRYRGRTS